MCCVAIDPLTHKKVGIHFFVCWENLLGRDITLSKKVFRHTSLCRVARKRIKDNLSFCVSFEYACILLGRCL